MSLEMGFALITFTKKVLRSVFGTKGYGLDPGLMVVAKLLVLVVVFLDKRFPSYGTVFVGILPVFDQFRIFFVEWLGESTVAVMFPAVWHICYAFFACCLFTNTFLRSSLVALSVLIVWAISASLLLYNNNVFFIAAILFILGVSPHHLCRRLISIQLGICYLLTTLSKALEPDWYNGVFMSLMLDRRMKLDESLVALVTQFTGERSFLVGMSFLVLALEFALGLGLLFKRTAPFFAVVALLFHSFLTLNTGTTFSIFYYAIVITLFTFVHLPDQVELRPRLPGSIQRTFAKILFALDFDRRWIIAPIQEQRARHTKAAETGQSAFLPVQQLFLFNPTVLFALLAFSVASQRGALPPSVAVFYIPAVVVILAIPFGKLPLLRRSSPEAAPCAG